MQCVQTKHLPTSLCKAECLAQASSCFLPLPSVLSDSMAIPFTASLTSPHACLAATAVTSPLPRSWPAPHTFNLNLTNLHFPLPPSLVQRPCVLTMYAHLLYVGMYTWCQPHTLFIAILVIITHAAWHLHALVLHNIWSMATYLMFQNPYKRHQRFRTHCHRLRKSYQQLSWMQYIHCIYWLLLSGNPFALHHAILPLYRVSLLTSENTKTQHLHTFHILFQSSPRLYRPVCSWMPLRPFHFAQLNFLLFLLLLYGDIHPNPGPTPRLAGDPTITLINDHLRLLNRNVRGIDRKLQSLPEFFTLHNVHVAILTETRRTLSHASLSTYTHLDGYTFHFSSHIDSTAASYFLAPHLCEWGVCIAIKDGLAFQPALVPRHFDSRLALTLLLLWGPAHSTIVLHILAIYAPANQQQKATFWLNLTNYLKTFAPPILSKPTQHLLLGGDWNSYINPSRDINRSPSLVTPPPNKANASDGQHNTFLCRFIEELRDDSIHLFDPLLGPQYTAHLYYTYANANFTYCSILDKNFTSFSAHHMEPTIVLDWDQYNLVGASDHRATLSSISLASLGQGWIEYPLVPFRSPPLINIDKLKSLDPSLIASRIASWKTGLPQSFTTILTSTSDPEPQSDFSFQTMCCLTCMVICSHYAWTFCAR
jgi:hypothetical protein